MIRLIYLFLAALLLASCGQYMELQPLYQATDDKNLSKVTFELADPARGYRLSTYQNADQCMRFIRIEPPVHRKNLITETSFPANQERAIGILSTKTTIIKFTPKANHEYKFKLSGKWAYKNKITETYVSVRKTKGETSKVTMRTKSRRVRYYIPKIELFEKPANGVFTAIPFNTYKHTWKSLRGVKSNKNYTKDKKFCEGNIRLNQ